MDLRNRQRRVRNSNNFHTPYTVKDGRTIDWGSWAALDLKGNILWQIPDPTQGAIDISSVSVANGVMSAGSYSGHMYRDQCCNRTALTAAAR